MKRHLHEQLETEVRFIAGNYSYIEEERLNYKDRDVLYLVGVASLDNSCCGAGGCRFLRVAGYVMSWKGDTDDSGRPISEVDPIVNEEDQREIKDLLDRKYPHSQIHFDAM